MRILTGILSFCMLMFLFSCKENGFLVEYANYKIEEPKNAELQCDDPCYYLYDRTVNLKLKYLK